MERERERERCVRVQALLTCGETHYQPAAKDNDAVAKQKATARDGGYIKWASSVVNGCGAFDLAANQRVIYILLCVCSGLCPIVSYVVHILPCLHIYILVYPAVTPRGVAA